MSEIEALQERIADLQRQVEAERRARLISPWVVRQQARLTPEDIDQEEKEREARMQQALARARKLARDRLRKMKTLKDDLSDARIGLAFAEGRRKEASANLQVARSAILDLRDALNRALKERDELRSQVAEGS